MDATLLGVEIGTLAHSWRRHLRATGRSQKTVETYLDSLEDLERFMVRAGMPTVATSVTREHVEHYMADLLGRARPATASVRYRSLKRFWRWAIEDGEVERSPMANLPGPLVPETAPRILSDDEVRALLATTEGNSFESRRDRALLLTMIDAGLRLSEVAGMKVEDVNLDAGVISVLGKARRQRLVSVGAVTVKALDRYDRMRDKYRHGSRPEFWLARKGPLTSNGVVHVVRRRSADAGLTGIHPHAFRHTFAHSLKRAGMSDGDVMSLGGWRSSDVMRQYGRALASERAVTAHKKLSPVDRLGL